MAQKDISPLTRFVPEEVITALTPPQLEEALADAEKANEPTSIVLEWLTSNNPALWYFALTNPMKYSLLMKPLGDDTPTNLEKLLLWDSEHLSGYNLMISQNSGSASRESLLKRQTFDSSMAALGNPEMTEELASKILDLLTEKHPEIPAPELCDIISQQLFDKWNPKAFSKEALKALLHRSETSEANEWTITSFQRAYKTALKKDV